MIKLDHLTKRFGRFAAVDDLSLEVRGGEIMAFLGPNGAGKTTTLRMIGGLLEPTGGRIEVKGHDLARSPLEVKRIMGFIPDRPYLYEKLTAREFLVFSGGLYGVPPDRASSRGKELLRLFDLADWSDELIESFSHGMKQRLVMASALLHEPEVLVIDEPMVGLDPRGARMLKNLFRGLRDRGVTLLLSTHTLSVAEEICDRVAIIHKGRLISVGTVEDLRLLAHRHEAGLEEVFLTLTSEGEELKD
ncbi:MAG: ABC transporter ATP-binding protein [Nitrospirae bacterium]|nr:ABC transporter ATP-binding protein [Nitrospirota bacterium]